MVKRKRQSWLWVAVVLVCALLLADGPALLVARVGSSAPPIPTRGLPSAPSVPVMDLASAPSPSPTLAAVLGPDTTPLQVSWPVQQFASVEYFGDSLSGGYFATTPAQSYVTLINAAVGERAIPSNGTYYGHSAVDAYAEMRATPPPAAQLFVIELGTDDTEDVATFAQAYQGALTILRQVNPQARVLCLGPWQPTFPLYVAEDAVIQSDCAADGGTFVDLMPLFAVGPYHGPVDRTTYHGPGDYFHPNDAGHAAIARALLLALRG